MTRSQKSRPYFWINWAYRETRDIVQNVYIRRVQMIDGQLRNVEFDKVEQVKDPVKMGDEALSNLRCN